MSGFEQAFPRPIAQLHELEFDYADGDGIDFKPYDEFQSASRNARWIRAWTGNQDLDAAEYRIFGQDGTGGRAGFWLVHDGKDILSQPIVFFGSEGALGVIACDFADYLWLLADGVGPMEAVENGAVRSKPNDAFAEFAQAHAPNARKSAAEVLARAKRSFPTFVDDIRALCS
jgi:hypothetical protein